MITYPNSLLNFNDEKLTFQLQVNQKLLYNDLNQSRLLKSKFPWSFYKVILTNVSSNIIVKLYSF